MLGTKIAISIAVGAIALVGCSGGDSESDAESATSTDRETTSLPPATTVATTTTTSTTTTTTTTIPPTPEELAGAHYLENVAPVNCARELFGLTITGAPGGDEIYEGEFAQYYATMLPGYEMMRDATLDWMNALIAYEWPASVREDVDELISEESVQAPNFDTLANTSSFDEWLYLQLEWPDSGAAAVIRAKLGLPSNIASDIEYCKELFGTP